LNIFAAPLPLLNRLDLDFEYEVGIERMPRQQQDADRAGRELLVDLAAPVAAARDLPVVPQFESRRATVLQRGRQIGLDFAEPENLARLRLGGLVLVAVADKDDRLCRHD
jgi:hypothetical protein